MILKKTALLGASIAIAMALGTGGASAVTTMTEITNGASVNLSAGPFRFSADIEDDGDGNDAEMLMFEFTNDLGVDDLTTITIADVDQDNTGILQNLFLGGVTFTFGTASKTVLEGDSETFSLSTLIKAGASEKLVIEFGEIVGEPDLDFAVNAVPLPPALVLLMSSIGGLALLSRRRAAA